MNLATGRAPCEPAFGRRAGPSDPFLEFTKIQIGNQTALTVVHTIHIDMLSKPAERGSQSPQVTLPPVHHEKAGLCADLCYRKKHVEASPSIFHVPSMALDLFT